MFSFSQVFEILDTAGIGNYKSIVLVEFVVILIFRPGTVYQVKKYDENCQKNYFCCFWPFSKRKCTNKCVNVRCLCLKNIQQLKCLLI